MEKNYTAKCDYMHVNDSGLDRIYQIHEQDSVTVKSHSIDEILKAVDDYLKTVHMAPFARMITVDVKISDDDDPDFILQYSREVDQYWQQQS